MSQIIKINLNPNKESDGSKASIRLDKEHGTSLKWYDCNDNVTHRISNDEDGLIKLDRMRVVIEMIEDFIKDGR